MSDAPEHDDAAEGGSGRPSGAPSGADEPARSGGLGEGSGFGAGWTSTPAGGTGGGGSWPSSTAGGRPAADPTGPFGGPPPGTPSDSGPFAPPSGPYGTSPGTPSGPPDAAPQGPYGTPGPYGNPQGPFTSPQGPYGGYPGAPQYGQVPGYGYGYAGPPQTDSGARNSLILSIVGIFICGILLGPAAIVEGVKARKRIRESNGRLTGDGLAIGGIVIGILTLAVYVIYLVIVIIAASKSPSSRLR